MKLIEDVQGHRLKFPKVRDTGILRHERYMNVISYMIDAQNLSVNSAGKK